MLESNKLSVNSYIQKPVGFNEFRDTVKQLGLYWLGVKQSLCFSAFVKR
jgi:hypothetical protein